MSPLFQPSADREHQVAQLLEEARVHFARRNKQKTIASLHQAQQLATQYSLHGEASQLRRALTILASGGRPKLLAKGAFNSTAGKDPEPSSDTP